jgi:hypothetical protein
VASLNYTGIFRGFEPGWEFLCAARRSLKDNNPNFASSGHALNVDRVSKVGAKPRSCADD